MRIKYYALTPFIFQFVIWRMTMRLFFKYFVGLQVAGIEHLKYVHGPVIFAPNHLSELDALLLPLVLPPSTKLSPIFYVVKERKFYSTPSFGWRRHLYQSWVFRLLGAFPVQSGLQNYEAALATHVRILSEGGTVCIFPEGRMSKTGVPGRAHGGVAYLAHRSERSIVPVRIQGTARISLLGFFSRTHAVSVEFLPPRTLVITDPTPEILKDASQGILDEICRKVIADTSVLGHEPVHAL